MLFLRYSQHKYLIFLVSILAYGLSLMMYSSFAHGQNNLGSFPQRFGDSMSAKEPVPFAPIDSMISKDAPTLEMLELFMQGGMNKLPPGVQEFLMKDKGLEPLPILVSPPQTSNTKTSYSEDTSNLAKVQKIKNPAMPSIQKPLVFGTIVPGMKPLFNPTMDIKLPNLPPVKPLSMAENTKAENTKAENTKAENTKAENTKAEGESPRTASENKMPENKMSGNMSKNDIAGKNTEKKQESSEKNENMPITQKMPDLKATADLKATNDEEGIENKEAKPQKELMDEDLATVLDRLSLNDLRIRAEDGDMDAQYRMGLRYFEGINCKKDEKVGLEWIKKSALAEYIPAMIKMGKLWERGDFGNINSKRAAFWYEKAADKGSADALFYLALLYDTGKIIKGKTARRLAMGYYRMAANMDHPAALYNLALFYDTEEDSTKDMGQAVQLYRSSAHLGYMKAQLQVGLLYESGNFLPQNNALAGAWYTKAAMQGSAIAQYLLASMYLEGRGVPRNIEIAIQLYEAAATQGLADAQFEIGLLYLTEGGEFYDKEAGARWLEKAADQGDIQALEILLAL